MKYSICIDAVLREMPPEQAIRAAHGAGFRAFEFWGWQDKDLGAIKSAKDELGMELVAFCTSASELTDPSRRAQYLEALRESAAVANSLGCKSLITQVGGDIAGVPRAEQHRSVVAGLKAAAPIAEAAGVTLLFEPLNTKVDHIGYYLYSSDEAGEIAGEVGSPSVKILFDLYHQQIMEGDLIRRSLALLPRIGHFHAAGNPGRRDLDDGEINYPGIFKALEAAGYGGYVGLEYTPASTHALLGDGQADASTGGAYESLRRAAALTGAAD